jgi:hypothetical protein
VNPEKGHAAAWYGHLVVKDSEIMNSGDDGVALAVKGEGGEDDVALD